MAQENNSFNGSQGPFEISIKAGDVSKNPNRLFMPQQRLTNFASSQNSSQDDDALLANITNLIANNGEAEHCNSLQSMPFAPN